MIFTIHHGAVVKYHYLLGYNHFKKTTVDCKTYMGISTVPYLTTVAGSSQYDILGSVVDIDVMMIMIVLGWSLFNILCKFIHITIVS